MTKTTLRKGFTLVELLFVMAIIAILAGFAIANLKDSSKTASINGMKNDARAAIAIQQTYFAENQTYDNADGTGDANGVLVGDNGAKFSISNNDTLTTASKDCGDGTIGFTVKVVNPTNVPGKQVSYDSCTDGKIQYVDATN